MKKKGSTGLILLILIYVSLGIPNFVWAENQDMNIMQHKIIYGIKGKGEQSNPYIIKSEDDLITISKAVNKGEVDPDSYYFLDSDIELNPGYSFKYIPEYGLIEVREGLTFVCYIGTENTGEVAFTVKESGTENFYNWDLTSKIYPTVINETTMNINGHKLNLWNPIGTKDHPFSGYFQGNNHYINGLFVYKNKYADNESIGLFGYVKGCDKSQRAQINNILVCNSFIGCCNYKDIIAGGIAGNVENAIIDSCRNNSNVSNKVTEDGIQTSVGGIVGSLLSYSEVVNCVNSGFISSKSCKVSCCGGIAGYIGAFSKINDSYNLGSVVSNSNYRSYSGGIIGAAYYLSEINNCNNLGKIRSISDFALNYGFAYSGGISGRLCNSTVDKCHNWGQIYSSCNSSDSCSGGVAGFSESGTIRNCNNSSNVFSLGGNTVCSGGIVGYALYGELEHSCNGGKVENVTCGNIACCGGLVGKLEEGKVECCYNRTEDLHISVRSGEKFIGSLFGYVKIKRVWSISKCYYDNTLKTELNPVGNYDKSILEYI